MTETVKRLKSELVSLTAEERAELVEFLLTSLPAGHEVELAAAWKSEVKRRLQEIRCGQARGVPGDQLLAELREQYP